MKRRIKFSLILLSIALVLVWLNNSSVFSQSTGEPLFIAHRGMAPEMHPEHEDYFACLGRIFDSEHTFIENTIPSIEAAFNFGADYVEIDVRLTADRQFAVFHDDVLDCKTETTGRLVDYSMGELKTLDVGYGYYTEDGRNPLRGKGVGLMPSLEEVLDRFPTQGFVVNIKSNDRDVAARLADLLDARGPEDVNRLLVFGGADAVESIRATSPQIRTVSRATAKTCLRDYMIVGWTGYVPGSCQNTATGMYANYAWVLWGWPHRFVDRMQSVDTMVILTHAHQTESIHALPESSEYAKMIPRGYSGAVSTNRIDRIQYWLSQAR